MTSFLKVPAAVLCCLVSPAYILLGLIFLDELRVIEFSPSSVPFAEVVPLLIASSLLTLAFWQFSIIRKVMEQHGATIVYLIVVSFNLFLCSFFFFVAVEELVQSFISSWPEIFSKLIGLIKRFASGESVAIIALTSLITTPIITALSITLGLEKKSGFAWCSLYFLLIILFPLGIFWLQPKVRKAIKEPAAEITDHFGI
jgi:hypothetical protein